jgi:hypothetical protein
MFRPTTNKPMLSNVSHYTAICLLQPAKALVYPEVAIYVIAHF